MKNINYVINGVLAVAVIILFVMQLSGKKESGVVKSSSNGDSITGTLPIAYVNLDSLLANYNYAKDLNEIILKDQENSRANIMQKARSLDSEMKDFQRKLENNAFLTRERVEQERARLVKKQEELQEMDSRLSQELMAKQVKMNEQFRDTVVTQLQVFNKDKKYQVIFCNTSGDNILWAESVYDITPELVVFLNKRYSSPAEK